MSALLLLVAGCDLLTYEPSRRNDVDVKPPVPFMALDFTNSPDTLVVWGGVRLSYSADLEGRRFSHAVLTVSSISLTNTDPGEPFELDARSLRDGYHVAVLQVFVSSGSGSLADRLGAEGFRFERRKTLFVQSGPPPELKHAQVSVRDGKLAVSWQPAPFVDAGKVEIVKSFKDPVSSNWVAQSYHDVTGAGVSEWVDNEDAVGEVQYTLHLHTRGHRSEGVSVDFSNTSPFVAPHPTEGGVRVAWRQIPAASSFGRYVIERFEQGRPIDWKVFSDRADTSLSIPALAFGERVLLRMRLEGVGGRQWHSPMHSVWGSGQKAAIAPHFEWAGAFWKVEDLYTLHRFDPVTGQLISFRSERMAGFLFSQDASVPRVLVVEDGGKIHLLDGQTLALLWSRTSGLPYSHPPGQGVRLANAHIAVVAGYHSFSRFEVDTGKGTGEIEVYQTVDGRDYSVTPDGRFVVFILGERVRVYGFDAAPQLVASVSARTCPMGGLSNEVRVFVLDNEEVALVCDRSIEVRSLPNLTLLRRYDLPMVFYGINGEVAYGHDWSARRFLWINLRTGVEHALLLGWDAAPFSIGGPFIIDSEGVYTPLESLR